MTYIELQSMDITVGKVLVCDQICQSARALFAQNFYVYFSPPTDGYNNRLTVHVCTVAKSSTVCFSEASFLHHIWCPWVVGWSINGLGKKRADRESPHSCLVRLGMNCDMWSSKQPELMPFGHIIFLNQNPLPLHGYPPPPPSTYIGVFVVLTL